jgi:hypothetical protein
MPTLISGSTGVDKITDGTVVNADMADDAIGVAELSATGTASSSTFLRGDNTWATAGVAGISSSADATAITIDSNERVGIGTAYPGNYEAESDNLVIYSSGHTGLSLISGTSSRGVLAFGDGTGSNDVATGAIKFDHSSNYMSFTTGNGERMRIDSSGKVGIGESSPAALCLHIKTGDVGTLPTIPGDSDEMVIENSTAGITFMSTTTGGGMLNFGDTDDADVGYFFYYHAQDQIWIKVNGTRHFQINSNGDLLATDTSIGSISDERVKENISDLTYDVAKFKQLRPRTFDWKNPDDHDSRSGNRGFIAQEIEAVDDYWVRDEQIQSDHADFSLLDSIPRSNAVLENGRIIAHGISESDWETGKANNTYPADSTWEASAEDARITKVSTLGKKDAMYISVINQLIERIEALENP